MMDHFVKKVLPGVIFTMVTGSLFSQNDTIVKPARSAPATLPDISVIGDFRASYRNDAGKHFNAGINETEISLQSVVDPYARADFFLSISKDPVTGRFGLDLEEAYITTLSLPGQLQLRAGKFRGGLGRLNPVHPHALPFITMPSGYENYFGEGINSEGFSLSWLIPNSLFYQELTFQLTDGPADNPVYLRRPGDTWLKLGHLKNFFDLSANATLEIGLTGISGKNNYNLTSNIGALDLTYKWKPVQFNTYKSFTWQTEAWISNADTLKNKAVTTMGLYSFINYQVSRRWLLTGMYSYSNKPFSTLVSDNFISATAGWYATEFQKIELEGSMLTGNTHTDVFRIMFRWIFVIGTHGAHQY